MTGITSLSRFMRPRLIASSLLVLIILQISVSRYYTQKHMLSFQAKITQKIAPKHEEIYTNVLDKVVDLLLPKHKAQDYIARHPGSEFSFYMHQLPQNVSWKEVSKCVMQFYGGGSNMKDFQDKYCDWGTSVCNPKNTSNDQYSTRRLNRNMDLTLSSIFAQYEGSMRRYNYENSSIYVVPFPPTSYSNCFRGDGKFKVILEALNNLVLQHLSLWNNGDQVKQSSHLFFQTLSEGWSSLTNGIVATLMPQMDTPTFKNLVMPYVNTNYEYQPEVLEMRDNDDKFFENKNISLAAVMSPKISGRSDLRLEFYNNAMQLFGKDILGIPVKIVSINQTDHRKMKIEQDTLKLYRQSIFCPVLRGDSPNQKRLFDVMLSGCIPVVMAHTYFDRQSGKNLTSHFDAKATPISVYLPFAKGTFEGEPDMGIDYRNIVVEVDRMCGLKCMKPEMESLMRDLKALRQKQHALSRYSKLFAYGMGENALKYPDAVSAMLVHARHKLLMP